MFDHSHKKYIVWKLAPLLFVIARLAKLVPDSKECTENFFTEECSILSVSPEVK